MRWMPVLLAACLLTVAFVAPSAAAAPSAVAEESCTGVHLAGGFTGFCQAPCYCYGSACQDWYANDLYLFHACWA